MLAAKRMRRHAAIFASVLGIAAIVSGLGTGLLSYLAVNADEGVRDALATRSGEDVALRLTMELGTDPGEQDLVIRGAIDDAFRAGDEAIRLEVVRQEVAPRAVDAIRVDGTTPPGPEAETESARVIVTSTPDLAEHVDLVEGGWPGAPDQITMQADAAEAIGWRIGDRVLVGGGDFELVGTWRVADALDPRWFGDPLPTTGAVESDVGPIEVDASAWESICIDSLVSDDPCSDPVGVWTIIPDLGRFRAADLDTIAVGWEGIQTAVGERLGKPPRRDGRLADTALDLSSRINAVRAVSPVAFLVVATIGLVTLAELARLLGSVRATEITLLRSRGASARRIGLTTAGEVAPVAVVGAAIGSGAGLWIVAVSGGGAATMDSAGASVWAVPLAVATVATGVVAGAGWIAARRSLRRDTLHDPGRARSVVNGGLVALVALAATISVWQLLLYGSPLTPTTAGASQVDPLAVLAPALALAAAVLIALPALPPVARELARATSSSIHLAPSLATRQIARRVHTAATPVVLVALASGQIVLAAAYSATWSESYDETRQVRVGAPIAIDARFSDVTPELLDRATTATSGAPVATVLVGTGSFGEDPVSVVAVTSRTLAEIVSTGRGTFDREEAAAVTGSATPGPLLSPGASGIRLSAEIAGFDVEPALRIQLMDDFGTIREMDLEPDPALELDPALEPGLELDGDPASATGATVSFRGDVPVLAAGSGQWRVIGIDVVAPPATADGDLLFVVEQFSAIDGDAETDVDLGAGWFVAAPGATFETPPERAGVSVGFRTPVRIEDGGTVRLLPLLQSTTEPAADGGPVAAVVVSQLFADTHDLGTGDLVTLELSFGNQFFYAVIGAIAPAIPGSPRDLALLMDLATARVIQLSSDDEAPASVLLWTSPADPVTAFADLRAALPADARIEGIAVDPVADVLRAASTVLWIGAAGAALLAAVAVSAVSGALLRARLSDVVLLRALGMDWRSQVSIRRREFGAVTAAGLVLGLISGVIVSLLTVALLARAAIPRPYDGLLTTFRVDPWALGAAVALFAAALAVNLVVYGSRVGSQARDLGTQEELR